MFATVSLLPCSIVISRRYCIPVSVTFVPDVLVLSVVVPLRYRGSATGYMRALLSLVRLFLSVYLTLLFTSVLPLNSTHLKVLYLDGKQAFSPF